MSLKVQDQPSDYDCSLSLAIFSYCYRDMFSQPATSCILPPLYSPQCFPPLHLKWSRPPRTPLCRRCRPTVRRSTPWQLSRARPVCLSALPPHPVHPFAQPKYISLNNHRPWNGPCQRNPPLEREARGTPSQDPGADPPRRKGYDIACTLQLSITPLFSFIQTSSVELTCVCVCVEEVTPARSSRSVRPSPRPWCRTTRSSSTSRYVLFF